MRSNYSKENLSQLIKIKAKSLGFYVCGIAAAEPVSGIEQQFYKNWITKGYQADMSYLAKHFEKRMDPTLLVPGTKSVIAVALNYYPDYQIPSTEYQLAWYAYGRDYHLLMREKMNLLFDYIHSLVPIAGRVFCDTAPVLDRYWAWKAGLGWIGKNTQLIIPKAGPTFFLGELFIDIELNYDTPQKSRCGRCTKCLESCPTKALEQAYTLNSKRCISYQTIENRGDICSSILPLLKNKIYGCDDCIKSCPWLRFAQPSQESSLQISKSLLSMTRDKWHELSVEEYRALFPKSAVKRAKYEGLVRNIKAVREHS